MATIASLGLHHPVGVKYLIREGLLPSTHKPSSYRCKTYVSYAGRDEIEEEIVSTDGCVIWSQGGSVRAVYRFDLEEEAVIEAVLTYFPRRHTTVSTTKYSTQSPSSSSKQSKHDKTNDVPDPNTGAALARALVVILKTKAHIHFLEGSHHVVDLPFVVETAFAAPRGLVLQKAADMPSSLPPTPKPPAAPHNSFFSSSQQDLDSSYLQSPTLNRRLANSSQGSQPRPEKNGELLLDDLWKNLNSLQTVNNAAEDELFFALSDPFSEPSAITEPALGHNFGSSVRSRAQPGMEFISLDPGECIVYVSSSDECSKRHSTADHRGELILIVTANRDTGSLTVWQAWYLQEKSLSDLMRLRAERRTEHAQRRTSFMTITHGTGANTPAVRQRDGLRESMVVAAQGTTKSKSKKPKDEVALASKLDPDFEPESTQQSTKETNRRISSLVSRGELSTTETRLGQYPSNASFHNSTTRRNTSFGAPSDRRSIGYRRSRGSTPGSVLSRHAGLDDDFMDLDSESAADDDNTIADIIYTLRTAQDAGGAESVLGASHEGARRDLVVRKIHAFDQALPSQRAFQYVKVITLHEPPAIEKCEGERVSIFILDRSAHQLSHLRLTVHQRPLQPGSQDSVHIAIPLVNDHKQERFDQDILKLSLNGVEAVLLGNQKLKYPGAADSCLIVQGAEYRRQNPLAALTPATEDDAEAGRNRILPPIQDPITLSHAGARGTFVETSSDSLQHQRELQLSPTNPVLVQALSVCELVLPSATAQTLRSTWFSMHQALLNDASLLIGTSQSQEWIATAATLLAPIRGLVDAKSLAALKVARMAARQRRSSGNNSAPETRAAILECRSAWKALPKKTPTKLPPTTRPQCSSDGHDQALQIAVALAAEIGPPVASSSFEQDAALAVQMSLTLHVLREEQKLNILSDTNSHILAPIIAQIGLWLNIEAWSADPGAYYSFAGASRDVWMYVRSTAYRHASMDVMEQPISVHEWLEHCLIEKSTETYPTLAQIAQLNDQVSLPRSLRIKASDMTPQIARLNRLLLHTKALSIPPNEIVEAMNLCGVSATMLETLPEGIVAPLREATVVSGQDPPACWSNALLQLVGRQDIMGFDESESFPTLQLPAKLEQPRHDITSICHAVEHSTAPMKTREASRNAISQLIFSQDRRLVHAASLLHFNTVQTAECVKQPDWSDAHYFDQQKRVMQFVMVRMIALPAGDALLHYDSQTPLMTERYHLPGFSSSCIMQPNGHTVTTDRSALTEEKVNWAYFHAGVSTGLRISRHATGIDTSWLVFNKPAELTNRHAGLLLALGLNGHLQNLAKWLSFKYLTPKHSMTSMGLLLGLAASNLGSMDGLITRMLSVHISCMLPAGAAELNVSPLTQTAGLMGIGLLYYNTQHRRMSETMLHEIENMESEDADSGLDTLRDESYRLAAGLALGFINLAHGTDLRGLHGIQLQDRLLRVAVGSRPVHAVHVFDKATAGAVMAIALIFMKTGNTAVARRIDIPDTENQFEHIRPDMLMLRSMAKHIILWDTIEMSHDRVNTGAPEWIARNLPKCCRTKWNELLGPHAMLRSSDLPLYYIITGLAWAVSLRFAGSGNLNARDEILICLDLLWKLSRKRGEGTHFYDTKLARSGLRRCVDVLALSAATVMAGTGDLQTFRHLRRLHGRTDGETPYGSHLAIHMGIGLLFMAGGTLTLGNSNLAVAALMCSLYSTLR